MSAKSTVELILELKNRLGRGLGKARETVRSEVQQIKQNVSQGTANIRDKFRNAFNGVIPSIDNLKMKNAELFASVKDQIPIMGRIGPLLSNPYVLAAAAVVTLITGIFKLGGHVADVTREIKSNQHQVQAIFEITGQELRETSSYIMAIHDTLGTETRGLTMAANALHREYADTGLSIRDSLDLIKVGLQATNGTLELDEIREYASQMRQVGLNAEEFIALSVRAKKEGIFGDKGLDSVKEFNLRVREMVKGGADAIKGIGLSSKSILKGIDDGTLTAIDALRMVSHAMKEANTQARQTAIADLFTGAGEDAGNRWLLSLADMDLTIQSITSGMEDVIGMQNRQITLNKQIRDQHTRISEVMGPATERWKEITLQAKVYFYTILADALEWFRNQWVKLEPLMSTIGIVLKNLILPTVLLIVAALRKLGDGFALVISLIQFVYNTIKLLFQAISNGINWVYNVFGGTGNLWDRLFGNLDRWWFKIKVFFEDIQRFGSKAFSFIEALAELNPTKISSAWDQLRGFTFRDSSALFAQQGVPGQTDPATSGGGGIDPANDPKPIAGGVGGASQVRNLTITMEALHKGDVNLVQEGDASSLSPQQFEDMYNRMLMRIIRNVELTAG